MVFSFTSTTIMVKQEFEDLLVESAATIPPYIIPSFTYLVNSSCFLCFLKAFGLMAQTFLGDSRIDVYVKRISCTKAELKCVGQAFVAAFAYLCTLQKNAFLCIFVEKLNDLPMIWGKKNNPVSVPNRPPIGRSFYLF